MNCFPLKNRRAGFGAGPLFCLCLLVLAFPGQAQTNTVSAPPTDRATPERFLLIVETSAAMQKRAANVQKCIGQMFSSSLQGQLHRGDTIGVWTYDNDLHTGEFPMQRWTAQAGREITIRLVQFIQQHPYGRQSRLAPVMAQLTNVVADSDKITVILVSDGSESLVGTPFDTQMAEAFKLNAAEQRQQAMPFVTILRAVKGKFVSLKVNTPPWPVELPAYPGELVTAAPTVATTPTHPPSVAPPKAPVIVHEPVPVAVETTNAVPPASNPPVAVAPPPVELPSNPAPPAVVTLKPVETNVASTQVPQTNLTPVAPAAVVTPVVKTEAKFPLIPILVGAMVVLVAGATVCLLLLKRSRAEPRVSLITRSMNKDGK